MAKKWLFTTLILMAFVSQACDFSFDSDEEETPTPGPNETMTALASTQEEIDRKRETLDVLDATATQEQEELVILEPEPGETQVDAGSEPPPMPEGEFGFPDPFDDNKNMWNLDGNTSIEGGKLRMTNLPQDGGFVTCNACAVTKDANQVSVEVKNTSPGSYQLGLVLDAGNCIKDPIAFTINPYGEGGWPLYGILQGVLNENQEFDYMRPIFDYVPAKNYLSIGQNTTHELSADYEFTSDKLKIRVYINGKYVIGFEAPDYKGIEQCVPMLYAQRDSEFDNFDIR